MIEFLLLGILFILVLLFIQTEMGKAGIIIGVAVWLTYKLTGDGTWATIAAIPGFILANYLAEYRKGLHRAPK